MFIFIRLKSILFIILIIVILSILGLSIYLWNHSTHITTIYVDETLNNQLTSELEKIFQCRNKALIDEDTDILKSLYNHEVLTGSWAHEHELTKLKYLHNWSDKQGVQFIKIDSEISIMNAKEKDDGFSVNLLVSTEYEYAYKDSLEINNTFRIGSYHYLDLMPHEEKLAITREWYTDPFADSLDLDEIRSDEIKQFIISKKPKDLSNLSERRINAVAYADQYAGAASLPEYEFQYNPEYRNYNPEGGNCTNFVSQVLYEGGGFEKNNTWNYKQGAGSSAWVNAQAFNNYMIYSGRASTIDRGSYSDVLKNSYELLPGDYIAYEKKGKVAHISIVTGMDSKGYALVNSHNSDRYRVPWDLGWSDERITFWIVRVHY